MADNTLWLIIDMLLYSMKVDDIVGAHGCVD